MQDVRDRTKALLQQQGTDIRGSPAAEELERLIAAYSKARCSLPWHDCQQCWAPPSFLSCTKRNSQTPLICAGVDRAPHVDGLGLQPEAALGDGLGSLAARCGPPRPRAAVPRRVDAGECGVTKP